MKPENKFRTWFVSRVMEYLHTRYPGLKVRFQKHADYVTSGIPDMDISISGITMWFEFKHLPVCARERKLNVTPLQLAQLEAIAQAGVPSGLLVGLALGPRRGYDVALYHQKIPSVALRTDFRPWTTVADKILQMAKAGAANSNHTLSQIGPARPAIVGHLPVLASGSDNGVDDAHEDGG